MTVEMSNIKFYALYILYKLRLFRIYFLAIINHLSYNTYVYRYIIYLYVQYGYNL